MSEADPKSLPVEFSHVDEKTKAFVTGFFNSDIKPVMAEVTTATPEDIGGNKEQVITVKFVNGKGEQMQLEWTTSSGFLGMEKDKVSVKPLRNVGERL